MQQIQSNPRAVSPPSKQHMFHFVDTESECQTLLTTKQETRCCDDLAHLRKWWFTKLCAKVHIFIIKHFKNFQQRALQQTQRWHFCTKQDNSGTFCHVCKSHTCFQMGNTALDPKSFILLHSSVDDELSSLICVGRDDWGDERLLLYIAWEQMHAARVWWLAKCVFACSSLILISSINTLSVTWDQSRSHNVNISAQSCGQAT